MSRPLLTLCLASIVSGACAQEPSNEPAPDPNCAATFDLEGEVRQISNAEVGLELARRERHRPRGQEALEHLVHRALVSKAAKAKGCTPTREEVERGVREITQRLQAQGMNLETFLTRKNLSKEVFERDYIALSLAHEKLVIEAAGLRGREEVTPELLALWLDEAKEREAVVVEAAELPPGIVARIGDVQLGLVDLGELLFQNASRNTIGHAVQQIAIRDLLTAAARARGIEVTQQEIDDEVTRRKLRIQADPTFAGVPYEELLKAQGTTIEELRRSPVIRAQVFRRRLVALEFTDDKLDERLAADRQAILLRHGARRHLNVILVRASDPPTDFVPLSFEAALERMTRVQKRLADGMSFAVAAKVHSDDAASKMKGGDVGLHGLLSERLPREVLDAAFHQDPFEVSKPIRSKDGYYLVMVSEIEDPPSDDLLRERLRTELTQEFVRDMLIASNLELAGS